MNQHIFYTPGNSPALAYCKEDLIRRGWEAASSPTAQVTDLILPVPSFEPDGKIKGGQSLDEILQRLPKNISVYGGFLDHAELVGYECRDLLRDTGYIAKNAAITAHCAIGIAMEKMNVTLAHCPVLVIGWGRIGKCLADLLRKMGANVTVFARAESDKAILEALDYGVDPLLAPCCSLVRYRMIINTAPAMVLPKQLQKFCRPNCLKLDLASCHGIEGTDVIRANGLPGKYAPESSGNLIAQTIIRLSAGKENQL